MTYTSQVLVAFLFTIFFFSACRFNPEVQQRGSSALQGTWEEEPLKYQDSLLTHTKHSFTFTCDSFYVTLETSSKVNYYEDSCYHNGKWKEYAKGNYVLSNDTLYIIGTFTKANFKQKISGCYRSGQYLPLFLIQKIAPGEIKLMNLQQHLPVTLKLKQRIKCNPQPL